MLSQKQKLKIKKLITLIIRVHITICVKLNFQVPSHFWFVRGQSIWFVGLDETKTWVFVPCLCDLPSGREGDFSVSRGRYFAHLYSFFCNRLHFSPDLTCVQSLISFGAFSGGQIEDWNTRKKKKQTLQLKKHTLQFQFQVFHPAIDLLSSRAGIIAGAHSPINVGTGAGVKDDG